MSEEVKLSMIFPEDTLKINSKSKKSLKTQMLYLPT